MKRTELIMGMPITIELVDFDDAAAALADTFAYFKKVDERYSTYKTASEISRINRGLALDKWSVEMRQVLDLCEQTRRETHGFFDIKRSDGMLDPSGLVKGWAIENAANSLRKRGVEHFYIEAGGDIQVSGHNASGKAWRVGIRNPFKSEAIVKTIAITTEGVATSGTYFRDQHIYDPHNPGRPLEHVMSITVIGPNIYEADRFTTAAFAMGETGIHFIESLAGFEGYMIDADKTATMTRGFERYVTKEDA